MLPGRVIGTIVIRPRAWKALRRHASRSSPRESGGILIGRLGPDRAVIEIATGPGPRAIHRRDMFQRDGAFSQRRLDAAVRASRGAWDYVGEWHSHPLDVDASARDAESVRSIAQDPAYQRREPLLVVLRRSGPRWEPSCYKWNIRRGLVPVSSTLKT